MAQQPVPEMPVQRWARHAVASWWLWAALGALSVAAGLVELVRADSAVDVVRALVLLLLVAPAMASCASRRRRGQPLWTR